VDGLIWTTEAGDKSGIVANSGSISRTCTCIHTTAPHAAYATHCRRRATHRRTCLPPRPDATHRTRALTAPRITRTPPPARCPHRSHALPPPVTLAPPCRIPHCRATAAYYAIPRASGAFALRCCCCYAVPALSYGCTPVCIYSVSYPLMSYSAGGEGGVEGGRKGSSQHLL